MASGLLPVLLALPAAARTPAPTESADAIAARLRAPPALGCAKKLWALAPLRDHPWLGRKATATDLTAALAEAHSDSALPLPRHHSLCAGAQPAVQLLWMAQGAEPPGAHSSLADLHQQGRLLYLSFKRRRSDALYYPRSSQNQGRNWLYAQACAQERRQGWRFDYFVVTDDDVLLSRGSFTGFSQFLQKWRPAWGVPVYGCEPREWMKYPLCRIEIANGRPFSTSHTDQILIAFHRDAVAKLWPVDMTYDAQCWWAGQWGQQVKAQCLYRDHIVVDPDTRVRNPGHQANYTHRDCAPWFCRATAVALRSLDPRFTACFRLHPDVCEPPLGRVIRRHLEDAAEITECLGDLSAITERHSADWPPEPEGGPQDECREWWAHHQCVSGKAKRGVSVNYADPKPSACRRTETQPWRPCPLRESARNVRARNVMRFLNNLPGQKR